MCAGRLPSWKWRPRKQSAANQGGRNPELALPMETRRSYEEAVKLLAQLEEQNQKMFKVNVLVFTYAEDLDTLQDNISQIMAVAREQNMKFDVLRMEQRKALNSVLPLGKNWLSIERTLTTSSTAIFVPFTTQELISTRRHLLRPKCNVPQFDLFQSALDGCRQRHDIRHTWQRQIHGRKR